MKNTTVRPHKIIKKMKPLHGVGNGPLSMGNTIDISEYYQMLKPPFARLHDTNFPESREVDVHTIFPDFTLDADEPDNYDFFLTDKYIKSIIDLGTDIIYRLGETIATNDKRQYVAPPADYKKYSRICVNIIRHYNDGWADGFHYNIKYWEIWNEPSVINMWTGTTDEWLELYKEIYTAVKIYNNKIMIGGPVACEPNSKIHHPFLEYIKKHDIIPDFYVFHCYTSSREHAHWYLDSMLKKLTEYNLTHLPAFITEWNYVAKGSGGENFWETTALDKQKSFLKMYSSEGASHIAMFIAILQDSFVYQANYFCVNTDNRFSCFSKIGLPEKPFYSLIAYKELYDLGNQVEVCGNDLLDEAYAIAASDGEKCKILLANFKCSDDDFNINIAIEEHQSLNIRLINDELSLESSNDYSFANHCLRMKIPEHTTVVIEFDL